MSREQSYWIFRINFDDYAREKEKDVIIGTDKSRHLLANRALSYTILYCGLVNEFAISSGPPRETFDILVKKKSELKQKYADNVILIPTEILDNGLTKEAFSGLKSKYEFVSYDEIVERIKSGNTKGYSQFLYNKEDAVTDRIFLMDLETGALHGYGVGVTMIKHNDYADDRRLKKAIDNIYDSAY